MEYREIGNRYLAVMDSHRLDDIDAVFSPDVRVHFDAAGPEPLDLAGWKSMVGSWLSAFPDLKPTERLVISDEGAGTMAVRMAWTATHSGDFMGLAPTGRTVHGDGVSVFRIVEGLVVEEWIYEDVARLGRQLGMA